MSIDDIVADIRDPEERAERLSAIRHEIRRRTRAEAAAIAAAAASAPAEKRCPVCEQLLPISAFGKNAARHDGRQSICRSCR